MVLTFVNIILIIQSDVAFAFVTVSIVYFQHLIIFAVKHTFYTKITEVHFLWFLKFYILSFYNFFREKNLSMKVTWLLDYFCYVQDYKLIFDKFDKDGDGYLSSDDVRNVLRSYDMLSTEGELQDVVGELDKKGTSLK